LKRKHSSAEVTDFIIQNVKEHPESISRIVSRKFGISRQSVNRYLHKLMEGGVLISEGHTRNKRYNLKPIVKDFFMVNIGPELEEDMVWRNKVKPLFNGIKTNVVDICHYGFTEMLNNVIDHSESKIAAIGFEQDAKEIELTVMDEGIGIFNKIARDLGLEDTRHAVLELSKGKLTTDREHHTGEGIFFTSRMFDRFSILSGTLYFTHHQGEEENWLLEDRKEEFKGTNVIMLVGTKSDRTTVEVFDKYAGEGDAYNFTRTHVPVALARYGEENLVSRSQAKRLLARLEPFKEVFLDFEGVDFIGQAFADEIFRVYRHDNPNIKIIWVNASSNVEKMIRSVIKSSDKNRN
jgi:hypothetical protein